jgi:hypothetical protein
MTTPFRLPSTAFLIRSQLHIFSRSRILNLHVKMRHAVVTEADFPRKNAAQNKKIKPKGKKIE